MRIKLNVYICRDCDERFLVASGERGKQVFCPKCGESLFTKKVTEILLDKPLLHKRRWTSEEDELVQLAMDEKIPYWKVAESLDDRSVMAVTSRALRLRKLKRKEDKTTCD